jgi:hypothetical protein
MYEVRASPLEAGALQLITTLLPNTAVEGAVGVEGFAAQIMFLAALGALKPNEFLLSTLKE